MEHKLRSNVLGHSEFGLGLALVVEHFSGHLPEGGAPATADEALR